MAAYFHVNFHSCVLSMSVDVSVLLPERDRIKQFEEKTYNQVKYQTLYLLHGFTGDYMTYIRTSNIERYADEHQIMVVMPSVYNSAYTDMKYGMDYFTYLSEELMDFIERTFPASPKKENRFVAGMSTVSTLCEALYGDPPAMTPEIHDIFTMMKNRKENGVELPRMYTCCGTEDRRYQDSVDLKEFADESGIPLVFENGPGKHDAVFFDEYIQKILDWMGFVGGPVE